MTRSFQEVWADYDRDSIVVYQAYNDQIADAAIKEGKFTHPFSFNRMTWIKPSFLWLMGRSGWGKKANQNRILAVRITRKGWEAALSESVLTHHDSAIYVNAGTWKKQFKKSRVRIQWDPERSLRGGKLNYRSIQVGIGRGLVREYAKDWVLDIKDMTKVAHKIHDHVRRRDIARAKRLLPTEKKYPLSDEISKRVGGIKP